ncbi:MAG: error-prone polymerase [Thermoleophilaceae bacterium]|nr:error-prone polymerase [Thermoleophilaceae bacterium]
MVCSMPVELHCHSAFSFLDGASHPAELAAAAAAHGYSAVALTDHDGLHGAMEHARACAGLGIKPITGCELTLDDGHHLTVLCETRQGYRNLCRLLTMAHAGTRPMPAGDPEPPQITLADLERHAEGLICLSGCAREGAVAARLERRQDAAAAKVAERLLRAFGPERFRIELQRPLARHDRRRNRLLADLAERLGVACVATGNVHVHDRRRAALQDAFVAVRMRRTLDESEPLRRGNTAHALMSERAQAERFRDHPGALEEAGRIAERIEFDLGQDLGYRYPGSDDDQADRKLAELCHSLLDGRYEGRASHAVARGRLDEELQVIRGLGLSGFFLLHRDMLELAREVAVEVRGPDTARALLPPGRGRGSSVSSIVCYLTGLSHVDPIEADLHLGRFLNEELTALPDIDLDFPRDIREKLIPRVHERYGRDRSALVCAFATYQVRGAIRDFGKVLGLPPGEIERAARGADPWFVHDVENELWTAVGRRARSPRWQCLAKLIQEAAHLPRHVSQHPGGMVVSTQPLIDLCPIQPCAMEGRQMVHWDKESCQDAGFLKLDLLGLGMLSAVERTVEEIARTRNERIDLSRIPLDDKQVYDMIQRADTVGVFQIESRAQMSMLPRTLPADLDDLTVQVALVRPGPIIGGAVHPYIERRARKRADPSYEVPYDHPALEPVLRETYGAIVFQDQVIEVAMAFAGFTAGEAEGLRRAMSKARHPDSLTPYADKFVAGATANGASTEVAERVFAQVVGFSGFGFPKAHSAAFGLLAYQSAWLRVHYGPEFLCGLLNEQPMGFYPSDALVHDAQRHGIEIHPVCVQRSVTLCRTEDGGVRMGLGHVTGVRSDAVDAIVGERERGGPFRSAADLAARCKAQRETLEKLAWAGACDDLCDGSRRQALWELGVAVPGYETNGGGVQLALPLDVEAPELRTLSAWERLVADYASTKVTLREHPLELMRPELPESIVTSTALKTIRDGARVELAGLVVARQRPATAKGITFMLLEDEHGTFNIIVPLSVHDHCRLAVRAEPFVIIEGKLERRSGVINVVAHMVKRLERPDLPLAEVRHIEPRKAWSTQEDGADLRAVAPAAHSFGRRG